MVYRIHHILPTSVALPCASCPVWLSNAFYRIISYVFYRNRIVTSTPTTSRAIQAAEEFLNFKPHSPEARSARIFRGENRGISGTFREPFGGILPFFDQAFTPLPLCPGFSCLGRVRYSKYTTFPSAKWCRELEINSWLIRCAYMAHRKC